VLEGDEVVVEKEIDSGGVELRSSGGAARARESEGEEQKGKKGCGVAC
jgi:hypothetical protein